MIINPESVSNRSTATTPPPTALAALKDIFSNSRNLVAGLVNQKKIEPERFKDVDFVAYEVIKPSLKPSAQMEFLENQNVVTVINEEKSDIDNTMLSNILVSSNNFTLKNLICTDR